MGWDKHGGRTQAAGALGLTTETIRAYALGSREVPRAVLLAMTALAGGLKVWSTDGEAI